MSHASGWHHYRGQLFTRPYRRRAHRVGLGTNALLPDRRPAVRGHIGTAMRGPAKEKSNGHRITGPARTTGRPGAFRPCEEPCGERDRMSRIRMRRLIGTALLPAAVLLAVAGSTPALAGEPAAAGQPASAASTQDHDDYTYTMRL